MCAATLNQSSGWDMAKNRAYDVCLGKRIIDTVFAQYSEKTKKEREEVMRRSLINHEGKGLK